MENCSNNGCGCASRLSREELVKEINDMRNGLAEDVNTSEYRFGAANALEWAVALIEGRNPVWVEKNPKREKLTPRC